MASNTAQTVFTGNASQLEAEYKKIDAARERDIAKLKKQLEESRRAANEEIRLKHDIARALEAARTPAEKYNETLKKYKEALTKGAITQEQFNRLRDVELAQLNRATKATDKLTEAKTKSNVATASSASAMSGWTGSLTAAATATGVLLAAVNALADAKRRLRKENEGDVFSIDAASRAYAAQTGLNEGQRIEARNRILKTGRDNAVLPAEAFAAATQLAGSGIMDPQSLDVFLKMRAGANEQLSGADPKELVEGMAMFMEGMGMAKTAKNFENVAQSAFGLFANELSSQTQVRDMAAFATAAPAMAASHITPEQSLAMLATVRQTLDASQATTGVANMISKLSTAKSTRSGEDALKMIGLKPNQVDFVGEGLYQVLGTLNEAISKAPEEVRNNTIAKLFGQEKTNTAAVREVLEGVANIKAIEQSMVNRKAFDAAVQMNTTGVAADMRRAEADKAIAATAFEGQIAGRAIIDKQVETARMRTQMSRAGAAGGLQTLLETGIDVPVLGNIGLNSLEDNAAEVGLLGQGSRVERAQSGGILSTLGRLFNPAASGSVAGSVANSVTGNDPQMAEQNAILRGLGQKLDKLAPAPGVRPNPATVGRPD